jgi:hypothetical protein
VGIFLRRNAWSLDGGNNIADSDDDACIKHMHGEWRNGSAAMIRSPLRLSDNLFTTMAIWVYTTRYFVGDFRNTGTQNLINATICFYAFFKIENQIQVVGADDPSRWRSRRLNLKALLGKNAGTTKEHNTYFFHPRQSCMILMMNRQ